ncbi:MAG: hypothetical protein A2087_07150 [Spirochaetes bacterium GWD1_61_31]|nr:MAG: hypothetical protein A2Y37_08320 [Spirochaetes bacterium GWB1_60_80]OHD34195.1 MAG: hypothetical protein A2004_12420 [Spirochaetes bacterium GWC1_61_12]OHD40122.1 MAG: hypothetical protein A2087_07150 [Spirochaetes bacterium GWD1_61_31]OHD45830.1 MAG: hypothetical protein A2Y35_03955 [Spirochaetes bacterium GWE1_60_18]OHD58373.1 MAG: hypothetical protein A2Y32_06345 [Spirochaetes bacterium GWF1_60_12]HAW86514.1 hypothetical protein [Spirochaetaceae bacterium]
MKKWLARLGRFTKGLRGALIITLLMVGLVLAFSFTSAHDRLEYVFYDLRFRFKPKAKPLPELVLLNVDDASIAAVGVYPWPRHYYAQALRQAQQAGLASLIFDFQFIDESLPLLNPAGFNYLYDILSQGQPLAPDDLGLVAIDNDAELAAAVAGFSGTVMPFSFARLKTGQEDQSLVRLAAIARFTELASLPLPVGREAEFRALVELDRVEINYPITSLIHASQHFGYVDSDPDLDGTHRRVRLVRVFADRIYLHLSLVTFLQMCGVDLSALELYPGRQLVIKNAVHPVTGYRGDIVIPLDDQCAIMLDWLGDFSQTARPVSAYALFEYPQHAEAFEFQLMLRDMVSGQSTRMELSARLEELKAAILAELDFEVRFPLRQEYQTVLAEYRRVIQGYLDTLQAEIDDLLARRAGGETVDETSIAEIRTLITAINIRTEVDYLFDSVAVIGLTATGTQDEGVTPLSNSYWMVGSYPTAINTLARGRFLHQAPWWAEFCAVLVLASLLTWFIHKRGATASYLAIALVLVAVNVAVVLAFFQAYLWIDQLSANLALLLPSALIMIGKFAGEEENRRFIQGAFSKYLSQEVIEQIIANPDALKLGGDSCQITTFFSDVAGFSSISEQLTAEGLVQLLNEYLSEMTDIIMKNRGTVDKYEGDAIMAFWGAPLHYPDHPYQACLSAIEMQHRLAEMRTVWRQQGRHELKVRMGINSGRAVAGNMGSHSRLSYTVMGDSVNLASRLEGANKFYGTYNMVSQFTYEAIKDRFRCRELDLIRVVGKSEPIRVYELLDMPTAIPDQRQAALAEYERGLELYHDRRWQEARNSFVRVLKIDGDDAPAKVYYKRCETFLKKPPEGDWDGVFNLSSK